MDISRIGIIGAGKVGIGVALLSARACLNVILIEAFKDRLEKAAEIIRRRVHKWVEVREIAEEEKEAISNRIQISLDETALGRVDFVLEATGEDEKAKVEILSQIESLISPQTVLASHSSLVAVTKMARKVKRPNQVVGLHFFEPVTETKLVEVVRGVQTSEVAFKQSVDLVQKMGLEVVLCHDFPGFVVDRVLSLAINEAIYTLYEGIANAADIDRAVKFGITEAVGLLTLADRIGLDRLLAQLNFLHRETGNPKFAPCPLLVKYVEAGLLGRKTGKGFYEY